MLNPRGTRDVTEGRNLDELTNKKAWLRTSQLESAHAKFKGEVRSQVLKMILTEHQHSRMRNPQLDTEHEAGYEAKCKRGMKPSGEG